MNKIIIALIGLALVATPALACIPTDPACRELNSLNDGFIATAFSADGLNVWFNDALLLNPDRSGVYQDGLVDSVSTLLGSVDVVQNVYLEDQRRTTDAISNTYISVDPWFFSTAKIEKQAWWNGNGEVYMGVQLGDTSYSVDAGTSFGDANFANSIKYNGDLTVYQSVGLGTGAICAELKPPTPPTPPECTWCIKPILS
jgi:hypothetical protein